MKKKTVDKQSILVGTLSINQILDQIDFEDEGVEHAARTLPKLFLETARYRVRVLRNRQAAEQEYDAARVDTAIRARVRAMERGTKITEVAIKELVDSDDDVRSCIRRVRHAQQLEEFAKLLVECLRMKKSAVTVVASLAGAERAVEKYFDAVQSKDALKNLRENARKKYEDVDA